MNDETSDEAPAPDPEAEEEDTGPLPGDVNPDDRFARSGKPVELADLIRASMGDLAQRTPSIKSPSPSPSRAPPSGDPAAPSTTPPKPTTTPTRNRTRQTPIHPLRTSDRATVSRPAMLSKALELPGVGLQVRQLGALTVITTSSK